MSTSTVTQRFDHLLTIDELAAVCNPTLKKGLDSQNWPLLYPDEVYRQAGLIEGRTVSLFDGSFYERQSCIQETNVLMAMLKAEIIEPLSQIPDLHKRIRAKVWDSKLDGEITRLFLKRMQFLVPPPDSQLGPLILNPRETIRAITANLMCSQFKSLTEDLVKYFQRHLSIEKFNDAAPLVVGFGSSVAGIIACWGSYCVNSGLASGNGTYTGRQITDKAWIKRGS